MPRTVSAGMRGAIKRATELHRFHCRAGPERFNFHCIRETIFQPWANFSSQLTMAAILFPANFVASPVRPWAKYISDFPRHGTDSRATRNLWAPLTPQQANKLRTTQKPLVCLLLFTEPCPLRVKPEDAPHAMPMICDRPLPNHPEHEPQQF